MVVKEVVSMRYDEPLEEFYAPLPQKKMDELQTLVLHYPGSDKDYASACELFHIGSESKFNKAFRKVRDKQRVYDDYKAFTRLNDLASLELTYAGSEIDKQNVEAWHLMHPSTDETDVIFQDKLEGLRNKSKLFFGDRSHPNIRALDGLVLDYPGWEEDYQAGVTAHCDTPIRSFPNVLHRLRERRNVNEGDRSHWRLIQLDELRLTYPGWESDIAEVEQWHFRNADTAKNDGLYGEVIEGMRDQQQIYLGWDHEEEDEESSHKSDKSLEAQSDFYKVEDLKDVNEMKKMYDSITESLNSIEGMKKKLVEERGTSPSKSRSTTPVAQRGPSPTARGGGNGRPPSPSIPRKAKESFTFGRKPEEAGPPPKQMSLGKCEVCYTRPKTHVFVPCGHLCACAACSHKAMETTACCPICRAHADTSNRVFLT